MLKEYYVYKHTAPSGKIYIGVTCKKPSRRWNNGKGYVKNKHFYNAIKKYGWENIDHEIIAVGLTKEDASKKERELISFYNSNDPQYGYNHTSGGYEGYELNDKQIEALKERVKKQFANEAFKKMFDMQMKNPERRKKVSNGLKQYYKTPGAREKASIIQKRKWENKEYRERFKVIAQKRASDPEYRKKLSEILTKKRSSTEYKESMKGENNPCSKCVFQYSLKGKFIKKFNAIEDACREVNGNHSNIIACITGRTKQAYGYIWTYEQDDSIAKEKADNIREYINPKAKPIIRYDLNGNENAKFHSITEASTSMGASSGTIAMALRGKRKTAYGYIWKYADTR
jgi:group I intron endonuclease